MKITFKNFLTFSIILLIYFLPSLIFRPDNAFYESLNGFKLPSWVFSVAWSIIYICLALFVTYHLSNKKTDLQDGSYKRLTVFLVINYFIMASYNIVFFKMHNLFLSYIVCLFAFVTILLAIMEAALINKKISILLLPYTIWSLLASVLSIMYYLEN